MEKLPQVVCLRYRTLPVNGRNKTCICACLFSQTNVKSTLTHCGNTDQMALPSPEGLAAKICLLQVADICLLLSLVSNDVYNSHNENLISKKSFILKTALKEAYPE